MLLPSVRTYLHRGSFLLRTKKVLVLEIVHVQEEEVKGEGWTSLVTLIWRACCLQPATFEYCVAHTGFKLHMERLASAVTLACLTIAVALFTPHVSAQQPIYGETVIIGRHLCERGRQRGAGRWTAAPV